MVSKRINFDVAKLPNEILEEIFLRLPIKTLVIQTSVCKLWNSLIKTSAFIQAHQNRNQHHHLLLTQVIAAVKVPGKEKTRDLFYLRCDKPPFKVFKSYYQHMTHPFEAYNRLHANSPEDKLEIARLFDVIETCNGLVCLVSSHSNNYTSMIWNPCIRKLVTLPRLTINTRSREVYKISHGFGYDSRTSDYKVVRIVRYMAQTGRKTSYEIWSLAQPSWKPLSVLPPVEDFCPSLRSIFVNGVVHWVHAIQLDGNIPYYSIVSFDMSNEVFGEILMPKVMMIKSHLTISRYRNYLAMLQWDFDLSGEQELEMWVMKEYGVVESWTKCFKIRLPGHIYIVGRLGFRNNGDALIRYDSPSHWGRSNYMLNPDSDVSSVFQARGGKFFKHLFVEPFVESLVLLDHPSAISTCKLN